MAANFKKGDVVKLNTVVPQGPVLDIQVNPEGEIIYLIAWTDAEGSEQIRWFSEAQLVSA